MANFREKVTKLHKTGVPILEAYVRFLLKTNDRHFRTYDESCYPCDYEYNAIVKTDDMSEMKLFFTKSKFFNSNIGHLFLVANSTVRNKSLGENKKIKTASWKDYFKNLTSATWLNVLQMYRNDFIYFDYHLYYCEK